MFDTVASSLGEGMGGAGMEGMVGVGIGTGNGLADMQLDGFDMVSLTSIFSCVIQSRCYCCCSQAQEQEQE